MFDLAVLLILNCYFNSIPPLILITTPFFRTIVYKIKFPLANQFLQSNNIIVSPFKWSFSTII